MIELKDDKLGRKDFLNDIFNLLRNFGNQGDKGLTIILNGKYGTGKTTLLNFIEEKNKEENNFNIIKYNAWENNTFENPLIPLLYCISKLESKESTIQESTKNVLKKVPKIIFGTLANACNIDLTSLTDNENFFDDFDEYKEAFVRLQNILKEYCANKKTILLVDELDRCLPEYQIKVLESIYHLLNIPNLITIIALDKDQLECSIKNAFGDNQNTYGYLSKFIDYEIELLEGNTYTYIQSLMNFECDSEVKRVIANSLEIIKMPIRECQNLINELNMICNEINSDGSRRAHPYWYPILVFIVLLVKRVNNSLYVKYFCKKREEMYTENMDLSKTIYITFMNDIRDSKIERVLNCIFEDNRMGKSLKIHFINTFVSVECVKTEDLVEATKLDEQYINELVYRTYRRTDIFPYMINEIIKKVHILNFNN